jgi:hypothetical protein
MACPNSSIAFQPSSLKNGVLYVKRGAEAATSSSRHDACQCIDAEAHTGRDINTLWVQRTA